MVHFEFCISAVLRKSLDSNIIDVYILLDLGVVRDIIQVDDLFPPGLEAGRAVEALGIPVKGHAHAQVAHVLGELAGQVQMSRRLQIVLRQVEFEVCIVV